VSKEASTEKKEESKANRFAGFDIKSLNTKEFIPKGMVFNTKDQFPDLNDLDDSDPK
jgi:hypothetical protein